MKSTKARESGTQGTIEAMAGLAKLFSCPVRLEIFLSLAAGPRCVCEIAALLELDSTSISRHLGALHRRGLVAFVPSGHRKIYAFAEVVQVIQEEAYTVVSVGAGEGGCGGGCGGAIRLVAFPITDESSRVEVKPVRPLRPHTS